MRLWGDDRNRWQLVDYLLKAARLALQGRCRHWSVDEHDEPAPSRKHITIITMETNSDSRQLEQSQR